MKPDLLNRTVAPTIEPITLAEAKVQLRFTSSSEDEYITALIANARMMIEEFCRGSLLEQTWVASYSKWPCDGLFELMRGPVLSVTKLTYYGYDDAAVDLSSTQYTVEAGRMVATLYVKPSYSHPVLTSNRVYPVTVTFKGGFGNVATSVPEVYKLACKLLVSHFFHNRLPLSQGFVTQVKPTDGAVAAILGPLRRRLV